MFQRSPYPSALDSDGNPILTQADLGKLIRGSGRVNAQHQNQHRLNHQQQAAATRNLYNKQQPLQYAPSHNSRRNYGQADSFSGYAPSGAASNQNSDADDDDNNSNFPNFGSNYDNSNNNDGEGEGSAANGDGPALNLNQAASGYSSQGDYNNNPSAGLGFSFDGASGYGPSSDGSEFGPTDGFSGEGRRAKSASSPMGARGFSLDDDAGAPQYGPNSAVNGDGDDEGRSGYAPEGNADNDNDDE